MHAARRPVLKAAAIGLGAAFAALFRKRLGTAAGEALVADGAGLLDLAPGFSYRVLERSGQRMDDGETLPGAPDGMACFAGPNDTLVLMRNHELTNEQGGVTRLVLDAKTLTRKSSNWVLRGTTRNCAGGPSPWGWLSCEEDVSPGHGYVFVCPTDAASVQPAKKVVGYGRFNHEAAAIEPATNICYLTEDRGDGCLYRFVPTSKDQPFSGKLQALTIGTSTVDTSNGFSVGKTWSVGWVELDNVEAPADDLRGRARGKGAASFARGEGIWYHDGAVYFAATSGGPVDGGQIFKLTTTATGGTLTLIAQSNDRKVFDMPDNLTVAPWGHVYFAEDGYGSGGDDFIRVLRPDGSIQDLASTKTGELAGLCFSPDGKALFVNLYARGITAVITGPFLPANEPNDAGAGDAGSGGQSGSGQGGRGGGGGQSGRGGGAGGSAGQGNTNAGGSSGSGGTAGSSAPGGRGGTSGGGAGPADDDEGGSDADEDSTTASSGCAVTSGPTGTRDLLVAAIGATALAARRTLDAAQAADEPGRNTPEARPRRSPPRS